MSKNSENKVLKSAIENTKASSTYEDIPNETQEKSMELSSSLIPIRVIEPKYNQDIRTYSKTQGGSK